MSGRQWLALGLGLAGLLLGLWTALLLIAADEPEVLASIRRPSPSLPSLPPNAEIPDSSELRIVSLLFFGLPSTALGLSGLFLWLADARSKRSEVQRRQAFDEWSSDALARRIDRWLAQGSRIAEPDPGWIELLGPREQRRLSTLLGEAGQVAESSPEGLPARGRAELRWLMVAGLSLVAGFFWLWTYFACVTAPNAAESMGLEPPMTISQRRAGLVLGGGLGLLPAVAAIAVGTASAGQARLHHHWLDFRRRQSRQLLESTRRWVAVVEARTDLADDRSRLSQALKASALTALLPQDARALEHERPARDERSGEG